MKWVTLLSLLVFCVLASGTQAQVVINEVLSNTVSPFIEVYAFSDTNLNGWVLTTDGGDSVITGNVTIPAGSFALIVPPMMVMPLNNSYIGIVYTANFSLNGSNVSLLNNATVIIDSIEYGSFAAPFGVSLERVNPLVASGPMAWALNTNDASTPNMQNSVFNPTPVANAGTDQNVIVGATVTLDGSASSDPGNDTLAFMWSSQQNISVSNESSVMPTFVAATEGTFTFVLLVSDGVTSSSDDVVVTVGAEPINQSEVLVITDVDASPSRVKPGDRLKVEISLENKAAFDLKNVELFVEILDEDGDVLEDRFGNELDGESEFDLDAGDDEGDLSDSDVTFYFDIPYDVQDNDDLTVSVFVEGFKNTGERFFDEDESEEVSVRRSNHEVVFSRLRLDRSSVGCGDTVNVDVELINVGKDEENVVLSLESNTLHLRRSVSFRMDDDPDRSSNEQEQTFTFVADKEGNHELRITAEYGRSIIESRSLQVGSCSQSISITEPVVVSPPTSPELPRTASVKEVVSLKTKLVLAIVWLAVVTVGLLLVMAVRGMRR